MTLAFGARLGVYEVLGSLGSGGMGEVYRARDTRLKRDVALKILPPSFATDPERLARFQREAEVLAALNHPNIAAIHGIEESAGVTALVMELVEGETLADRIAGVGRVPPSKGESPRGEPAGLPLDEALPIARQIAEALEAAHERGIIHRDLKPANIKVRPDGVVKVLDFGLAKLIDTESGRGEQGLGQGLTAAPTITSPAMTQAGIILGTAAYMSPEQAKGRNADKRSDIWAFGCVLYEMLTGRRAFEGDDVADTLANVLKTLPQWDALPATTPAAIQRLLSRCLAKDSRRRLRDIGDALIEIDEATGGPPTDGSPPQPVSSRRQWIAWASVAILLIALAVLVSGQFRTPLPAAPTLRYTIAVPDNSTVHSFAISPDGRYVAIAAGVNGKQQLWLRSLDTLESAPMATTDDATYPFWSPDSRYIGFFAQGKLKKIAATGGPAQSVCDAVGPRGGTWNRDDVILFSQTSGQGLHKVPAAGGVPADVLNKGGAFRYPAFLPDGRHFLYTSIQSETGGVFVGSLDGAENRRLLPDRSAALFAPSVPGSRSGHLLFVRENNLMAMPFDAASAQSTGDVFPVAEGVSLSLVNAGFAPVSTSDTGVLLHWSGVGGSRGNQIVWYDRTGKLIDPGNPVSMPGEMYMPAISPDEKVIALVRVFGGAVDIWLRDLVRTTDTRLTIGGLNTAPSWSPSGDRILYSSAGAGAFGALYLKAANGSSQAQLLLSSKTDRSEQWSRDGRFIIFTREMSSSTQQDVWVLPMDGTGSSDRKPFPFLQTPANEFQGQLSPDSRWIAYTSDESGEREVYMRSFPDGSGRWKISTAGGEQPRWRADGRELFYVAPGGRFTAVALKAVPGVTSTIEPAVAVPLFESRIAATGTNVSNLFQYDVTGDGKRFLVVTTGPDAPSSPPLTVVVNWTAGLAR